MDHGGEAARPTTVGSTELGMAGAVRGSESSTGSGTFDGELGAAAATPGSFSDFGLSGAHHSSAGFARQVRAVAARGEAPVAAVFHLHREPGPGVAYANIGEFRRQLGLVDVALLGPHLPDGVVQVLESYGYSALQPRPRAGRGVVLAALLPGGVGAVYNGDYALQLRPGAGHGEVLVDLLPDDAGHGEAFVGQLPGAGVAAYDGYYALQPRPGPGHGEVLVDLLPDDAGHDEAFLGQLPGGGVAAYDDYGYYALQPRPDAGRGEVLVDMLPDVAGHGEVFVDLLSSGGAAVHDDYGYYAWACQPRPGAGSGAEEFLGPLRGGVGAVFDNSSNFVQQTVPGTKRADGIAGALRGRNLGAGYDGSGVLALADDLGAVYDNPGMVAEHLRRLLPFAGIGAFSLAVNGLAAGPGSPAVAFHLFAMFLGGLFLVILHVIRVK